MKPRESSNRIILYTVVFAVAALVVIELVRAFAPESLDSNPSDPDYGKQGVIHIRPPKGTMLEVEVAGTFETAKASGNLSVALLPGPGTDTWKIWTSDTTSQPIAVDGSRVIFRVEGDSTSRKTTATFYPKKDSTASPIKITILPKPATESPRPYRVKSSDLMPGYKNLNLQVEEFELSLLLEYGP